MADDGQAVWCYIGRTTTPSEIDPIPGTIVVAVVDTLPDDQIATQISEWAMNGMKIERVPLEWARKYLFSAQPYQPLSGAILDALQQKLEIETGICRDRPLPDEAELLTIAGTPITAGMIRAALSSGRA